MAVFLVTGAATQIGRNIVHQLLQDGHDVAITDPDRRTVQETVWKAKDLDGTALRIDADLGAAEDTKRLIDTTIGHYGRIDAAINALWCVPAPGRLHELEHDYFDATLGIFMRELHLTTRALLSHYLRAGQGVIFNITSAEAVGAEDLDGTTEMVSCLTQAFSNRAAVEYAAENIRIRALCGMAHPVEDVCRSILSDITAVTERNPIALATVDVARTHAAS